MAEDRSFIYLNNAATSWPKPPEVLAAVSESLSLPVFGSGRTTASQGEDCVTKARDALSGLLGVKTPGHVVFTQNATDSLNVLIQGFLKRHAGTCHVLTTALDHNSVLRPLHEYERQGRIRLTVLPFEDGRVSPGAVAEAITPMTRLMVMTHASNVLGTVQDIQAIGEVLHDHGACFVVDGAQAAGHVPINLESLPVDAYAFTGHKALLGIAGTGGFAIKDPEAIAPVRFGGTGTDSFSLLHPTGMPERFEAGTHNYPGLAGLAAGVSFILSLGIKRIMEKAGRQTAYLIRELEKEPNITIYHGNPDLPIIAFNIRDLPNDDVGFILARRYKVIGRTGLHCAPLVHQAIDGGAGCVRLSHSWFTTDEECRIAAGAVREIAQNADRSVSSA
ncbi:MAG: putative cysteine desulfurase 2 [Methanoregulaceae archaeon PtaB.Bin056]|nr:MAG: putative cysteine desulfurase 2 [Methanoregulaceae archaeon PtaB.Bin056]